MEGKQVRSPQDVGPQPWCWNVTTRTTLEKDVTALKKKKCINRCIDWLVLVIGW
jgi:hypothetical protein